MGTLRRSHNRTHASIEENRDILEGRLKALGPPSAGLCAIRSEVLCTGRSIALSGGDDDDDDDD